MTRFPGWKKDRSEGRPSPQFIKISFNKKPTTQEGSLWFMYHANNIQKAILKRGAAEILLPNRPFSPENLLPPALNTLIFSKYMI